MLKLTLNLKLSSGELGAIIKLVNTTDEGNIPCGEFLRYFMRVGYDGREKEKNKQRMKQAMIEERNAEENARKITENFTKAHLHVDYNFSEMNEVSAIHKMTIASTKYDKTSPGAQSLEGFECESLTPGEFVNLIRRVFNITFTSTELGYVVKKYDTKDVGNVTCKAFLIDFMKYGQENRHKAHIQQLEQQKMLTKKAEQEHVKRMEQVKESIILNIDYEFAEEDLKNALAKLTEASIRYDSARGVSLTSFEPATLSPREFMKGLRKTFNINLPPKELGALVIHFDKDGTSTVQNLIHTNLLCYNVYNKSIYKLIYAES